MSVPDYRANTSPVTSGDPCCNNLLVQVTPLNQTKLVFRQRHAGVSPAGADRIGTGRGVRRRQRREPTVSRRRQSGAAAGFPEVQVCARTAARTDAKLGGSQQILTIALGVHRYVGWGSSHLEKRLLVWKIWKTDGEQLQANIIANLGRSSSPPVVAFFSSFCTIS